MRGVRFDVPARVAFAYLVDPRHRPDWQSSLRRVEDVRPDAPAVGQRWVDVTVPGLRPLMETTVLEPSRTWTEVGAWHGVAAELTLDFAADGGDPGRGGCLVTATFRVSARGAVRPAAWAVGRAAGPAVRADLRRAARNLSRRRDA